METKSTETNNSLHLNFLNFYEGKHVIVRSYDSGVHFGKVKYYDPVTRHVLLEDSRRLWYWRGFTLSYCANHGMADDQAKLSETLKELIVANVIELLPCSEGAIDNMKNYSTHAPL